MREILINLTAAEIRAYQGGETVLRRKVEPQPPSTSTYEGVNKFSQHIFHPMDTEGCDWPDGEDGLRYTPFGAPGDVLVMREKWQVDAPRDGSWSDTVFYGCQGSPLDWIPKRYRTPKHVIYAASWAEPEKLRWRSSTHMPRWAVRYTPRVLSSTVERRGDTWEWVAVVEAVVRENRTTDPGGEK